MVDLQKLIRAAREMAPMPASAVRLAQLVNDPDAGIEEVAELVALDQGLTMRMLRIANSAFSASETRVVEVREAVLRLGAARVLAFALGTHAHAAMQKPLPAFGLAEHELWKHSVRSALAVEVVPSVLRRSVPAPAFAAALLHDVGKLVMDRFLSEEELDFMRRVQAERNLSPLQAEAEIVQVNHAELGGVVVQHWNLPEPIVQGVTYHHEPERVKEEVPDFVYLANLAAKVAEEAPAGPAHECRVEAGVVERTGIDGAAVRELAEAARQRFGEVSTHYDLGA